MGPRMPPLPVLTAVFLILATASPAELYAVREIGTLGGDQSYALGLNEQGHVVGWATNAAGQRRAFRWLGGDPEPLGTLGGATSEAWDINEAGLVVGESETPSGEIHAFLYDEGGMLDIQTLPDTSFSVGWSINERNEVVGAVDFMTGFTHAFRYASDEAPAAMRDLHGPDAGAYSEAFAINDMSAIAGTFIAAGGNERQAFYGAIEGEVAHMLGLGTLGGTESAGLDMNNVGQVVGWAHTETDARHAFLWSGGTELQDLHGLDIQSEASAVNNRGHVVGVSYATNRNQGRAFLWKPETGIRDLNNLLETGSRAGWQLQWARDINDRGWIVGRGVHNGLRRGFVLIPITGDVNRDESVNAADVQLCVNAVLGVDVGDAAPDLNLDGRVDAVDVQLVVNAVLGML
jgi:probable HAF family extracellular repeat protein